VDVDHRAGTVHPSREMCWGRERPVGPGGSPAARPARRAQRKGGEVYRIAAAHEQDVLAALSAEEREHFRELLIRIARQQGLTPGVHPGYRHRLVWLLELGQALPTWSGGT
jgi:hypothetical protein